MPDRYYYASPYTRQPGEDNGIEDRRFRAICCLAAEAMAAGQWVYSPIAHSHPLAVIGGLDGDFDFWQRVCLAELARCDALVVVQLPGWDTSRGVWAEIREARRLGMPIEFLRFPGASAAPVRATSLDRQIEQRKHRWV